MRSMHVNCNGRGSLLLFGNVERKSIVSGERGGPYSHYLGALANFEGVSQTADELTQAYLSVGLAAWQGIGGRALGRVEQCSYPN